MLVDVALPLPLFRTFTYRAPHALAAGTRVVVPFRARKEMGVVVGEGRAREGVVAREILAIPDAEPAVDAPLLALCRWIAEYYVVPFGVALRTALPAALTGAEAPMPPTKRHRVARVAGHLPTLMQRDRAFARAPQQRALFELLESLGGRAAVTHLVDQLAVSAGVLRALVTKGLVVVEEEIVARDPFAARAAPAPARHAPTLEQRRAIDALVAAPPGHVALLHGVTGSGKTLVYLEYLRHVVDVAGRSAIVLVPEIALTPQTVDRFRAVFGDRIAVLHSALSDGERYDAWLALRRGEKRIAVGARSAVFAPLRDLGAIIVDEEHEATYKQGESPRYHAREVAIVRARAEGAVVVLGSATPSLESWTNARSGKFSMLSLPSRVGGGRLPRVEVADLRVAGGATRFEDGAPPASILSEPLVAALADGLRRGEQSILLLNRRGYASFVQCAACGDVATCPNCSITLTYHRAPEQLVCHYCQHNEPPRRVCARCGGTVLRQRGLGTQQVERILGEHFPAARIARMDVDTTSAKWSHTEILDRVGAGAVDILLGTQMIAKGLDFPNVTFVGVIDADVGINLPDFRASERCFQLLSQVAGRAGRGPKGGRVLIQTRAPEHHAVRCALAHDYEAFVAQELPGRAHPPYPPNVRLANIVFSGLTEDATARLAASATAWLHALLSKREIPGIAIVGPAPCPIERIKNRWRWHVLVKAEHPGELTRLGRYLIERFPVPKREELRLTFDRDPVQLL